MYEVELYKTERDNCPLLEYLMELRKKHQSRELAKIEEAKRRLEKYGMDVNNHYPHMIRNLQEGVWELRPGNNRVFFFHFTGNKFVLLHAYKKESPKTPENELKKAINEMKDYKRRNRG
ncbi:MAG: type II toxin-antitoxin system RelE/ParE family toxin [Oscillospiraceae bacterium]|nr:type II toxin-antitoxin system RelE/ParE family toxin [Oscillospiraceae bacterium]